jgi:hypothetical protein
MADAIVIGAGPAGLAAAAMLKQAGAELVVLDKADAIGASWRRHYDRLHMHTVRWLSHLPGYRLGYSNPISGMFREINMDARRIGYAFARDRAARNGGAPWASGGGRCWPCASASRPRLSRQAAGAAAVSLVQAQGK